MDWLTGIHAVEEALRAGRPLDRVLIARGRHGERMENLARLARARGIPLRFEERSHLDHLVSSRDHQGIAALASARSTVALEDLLRADSSRGLLVLLDGVEDPHNLGAIARSALAAGAGGLIVPTRRAAGVTDAAERASAGALAHLPVARVTNLARAAEQVKQAGFWIIGLDENGQKIYTEIDFRQPVGVVLGGEGAGLHELTKKRCDFLARIPTAGPVRSLNVSVAAGIALFEVVRQRASAPREKAGRLDSSGEFPAVR